MPKPANVDEYLAAVPSEEARSSLEHIRAVIRDEVPEAEEVISYGIPTYKLKGFVVSIAAFKNHCSFFPGHTVAEFAERLKGYEVSKGTIQFPHDKPPPDDLLRAMVRARADENLASKR
ncbi:MAG TPA: DUF1801 domain-containing protein [Fimbriimonadaceae bacterium]|nr:DUF1801 domain-containing protein [Fimbriimonadaceae bacterium]